MGVATIYAGAGGEIRFFGPAFLVSAFLWTGVRVTGDCADGGAVFIPRHLAAIRKLIANAGFANGVFDASHLTHDRVATGRGRHGLRAIQTAGFGEGGTESIPGCLTAIRVQRACTGCYFRGLAPHGVIDLTAVPVTGAAVTGAVDTAFSL